MDNQFDYQPAQQPEPVNLNLNNGHASGYALAALILGILTLVFCCCCFFLSIITGILSIIFACLAKRDNGHKMPGMAIAGMILGILGLVLFIILMATFVIELSMLASMTEEEILAYVEKLYADMGIEVDLSGYDFSSGTTDITP